MEVLRDRTPGTAALGRTTLAVRILPLTPRLYRRKESGEAEGVPFVSKIDLADQEVTSFTPPPDTHTHLLMDAWYTAKHIWRAALVRG